MRDRGEVPGVRLPRAPRELLRLAGAGRGFVRLQDAACSDSNPLTLKVAVGAAGLRGLSAIVTGRFWPAMKLYVCYGTWRRPSVYPAGHPCGRAYQALREAGHDPEVVKSYGLRILPDALNQTAGRKRAKELTGSNVVPVLELDDGSAIGGSDAIVAWAKATPA